MRPRQKVTRAGILLIAAFEGLRRRAARLPDGRWTIGYGHTLSAREGAEVSEEDAQALLHFDLLPVAEAVNNLVYTPLTQNQFDALTAFAYNVGIETFRSSDVLKRVNEGRLTEAACALDLWRKADLSGEPVILDALIRRRAAEKALFLTPHDGFVPTPSPLVRPTVDTDLAPALPQSRPAEIDVPMEGVVAEVVRRIPPVEVSHEPIEITRSDVETPETLPEPSVPVEAAYSDEIPVETPQEIETQALEAGEPGAEAMAPVEAQPVEPAPEPLADIPSFDTTPIIAPVLPPVAPEPEAPEPEAPEPEAAEPETSAPVEPVAEDVAETFPAALPVEAVEAAEDLAPVDPFPAAEASQPEPEAAIPAIAAVAERIYAPEPEVEPQPEPAQDVTPEPTPEPVVAPEPLPFEPPSGWSLTPPPEVIEQPPSRQDTAPPRAANEDEDQVALFDPSEADQGVAGRIIRYEEIDGGVDIPERPTTGPFILMGVIGLAAFGGAISAFIKARNDVDGLEAVAWLLALIGACLVGTSIYFLLKRLGGVDE